MLRTPNTLDAHRLIWFAGREGVQDAVMEAVFVAYFTQGRDIGDRDGAGRLRRAWPAWTAARSPTSWPATWRRRRCWPQTAPRARPE